MYPYEIDIEKSDIHFEASGNYLIMKVKKGVISGSNPIDEIHLSQNYLFGYIQIIRREKAREQEVIPIASPTHVELMRACRVDVDEKYTALKNRVSAGDAWGSLIAERELLDSAIDVYIKSISKAELYSSLSSATTNGLIAQAKSILSNATATTERMNGQHDTIIQTHKIKPNVLEQLNTARLNLRNALIDLERAVNDFCLSKPTQEIFDNNILPTHKEFKRQVRLYQTAITIATGGHAGLEGLTAVQISQADSHIETAHNTLAQLTAQHTEVVARRRFTQAALSDLNAKKKALTDAVATLQSKVEAFKQSEQITEASYQTSVKPSVDAYTAAMEAYQAAITKADEGKDGKGPFVLTIDKSSLLLKGGLTKAVLKPQLTYSGEDITEYSINVLGVRYMWERYSNEGVDPRGKTDEQWNEENIGKTSVDIYAYELTDSTEYSVGFEKESVDKVINYINTKRNDSNI